MWIRYSILVFCACALAACGYSLSHSTFAQLEVPSLNESSTDTRVDNPDMIATKMKFGDKQDLGLGMLMYGLKDQNFVVSNNSRICPDQNCKFQFKDTNLVYQPNSNDITMKGNLKINTGEVTKITNFYFDLEPTEAREKDGLKNETVEGTFNVGKEPINGAEFQYNVNGTIESQKGGKILSLQGVQCNGYNNGILNDDSKEFDCGLP